MQCGGLDRVIDKDRLTLQVIDFEDMSVIRNCVQRVFEAGESGYDCRTILAECSGVDAPYFVYYGEELLAFIVYKDIFNPRDFPVRSSIWLSRRHEKRQWDFMNCIEDMVFGSLHPEPTEPLPEKDYMKLLNRQSAEWRSGNLP